MSTIQRNGSQPSVQGPKEYFTGHVRIDTPFQMDAPARAGGALVTFEPGARRLDENVGAADVELSDADLREIATAAAQIHIEGERYAPSQLAMVGRDAAPAIAEPARGDTP